MEDLERNDGTPERPYFMSLTLKKILNKTNKRQAEAMVGGSVFQEDPIGSCSIVGL